jgi:hypothetical protein
MKQVSGDVYDHVKEVFDQKPYERQAWYYFAASYCLFIEFTTPELCEKMGILETSPKESYEYVKGIDDTFEMLCSLGYPKTIRSPHKNKYETSIASTLLSSLQEDAVCYPDDLILSTGDSILNSSPEPEERVNERICQALQHSLKIAENHYDEFGYEFYEIPEYTPPKSKFSIFKSWLKGS